MKDFYDIDALKVRLADYIGFIKDRADISTVGETAVSVADFIDFIQRQSAKEDEE